MSDAGALSLLRRNDCRDLEGGEVSPPHDTSEISAIAAPTVAQDGLCPVAKAKGAKPAPVGSI